MALCWSVCMYTCMHTHTTKSCINCYMGMVNVSDVTVVSHPRRPVPETQRSRSWSSRLAPLREILQPLRSSHLWHQLYGAEGEGSRHRCSLIIAKYITMLPPLGPTWYGAYDRYVYICQVSTQDVSCTQHFPIHTQTNTYTH